MAVTNAQIVEFLLANPGMSDSAIAAAMDMYGVTPAMMAEAVGIPVQQVQQRYEEVKPQGLFTAQEPIKTPEPVYVPEPVYTPPKPSPEPIYAKPTYVEPAYVAPAPVYVAPEPAYVAPTPVVQPTVTNQQIVDFIVANPTITDTQLAAVMQQYDVSPEQVAVATGTSIEEAQQRYEAVTQPVVPPIVSLETPVITPEPQQTQETTTMAVTSQQIIDFLVSNPGLSDSQIVAAMETYGVSPAQMAETVGLDEGVIAVRVAETLTPGQTVTLGDTIVQPVYTTTGSGEDQQVGGLENVITYKADENKVDGAYTQYLPTGEVEKTGTQQEVKSGLKEFAIGAGLLLGLPTILNAGAATTAATVGTTGLTAAELALADLSLGGAGGTLGAETLASALTTGATVPTLTNLTGGSGLLTGEAAEITAQSVADKLVADAAAQAQAKIAADAIAADAAAASKAAADIAAAKAAADATALASTTGLGSSLGTGLTAGSAGLGLNAAGTAGLGAAGTGAGITAGTGLGTGVLSGSTLGTGLLGTAAGAAGLTGTGILAGSTLGTGLLGTTGTGALTGTGVLTGSGLGTQLLGTGAGTAATVGGLGNTVANLGTGALTTGLEGLSTGLTGLGTGLTSGLSGLGTNLGTGLGTGLTGLGTGIGTGLTNAALANLISTGLTTGAGLLQQQTSKEAAQRAQAMIDAETAAAKQSAAFRPIGMTTRFGTSQFAVDPVTGQLTSAGYTLSPEAKNAQDRLVKLAESGLVQAEGAQAQFAPLQTGAQALFGLGNQYLAQSPQDVAQNYLNQQMALLQPGRELELANLQNRLQQQGRGGLSVAQGGTMGATTPELQALFNARAQQEAQLAAQAQQAGQQQVLYGAGLLGQGTTAMGNYYAGQQGAYAPYTTALGQVQGLEQMAQQPFTMAQTLAQQSSAAGARMGELGLRGAGQSVALATGPAATTNP
jgi:hypothetical protein